MGSSGNPPSITDEPIIKDKLLYTSLGYANSKLDTSHQKISIAIFCIYKLKMSALGAGFNRNGKKKKKKRKKKNEIKASMYINAVTFAREFVLQRVG